MWFMFAGYVVAYKTSGKQPVGGMAQVTAFKQRRNKSTKHILGHQPKDGVHRQG